MHDGAGVDFEASCLQPLPDFGEKGSAQFVPLSRRQNLNKVVASDMGARPRSIPTAAKAGAVVERLLACQVSQIEPMLNEVNAQHALPTNGRTALASFGVMGLDDFAQCPHGTMAFTVFTNSSRRVGLRRCSIPES